jgi:hypothetical protein
MRIERLRKAAPWALLLAIASLHLVAADPTALKVQGADALGNPLPQGAINGAVNDSWRSSENVTVLPSALRTATTNGVDTDNPNCHGVTVCLNVTAASGSGGLQIRIQGKDPISLNYVNLNPLPTAVIATGTTNYIVFPGVGSGNLTQGTNGVLWRTWRVQVIHGDATNYTYSVSAITHP